MLLTIVVVASGCDYCDAQRQDGVCRCIENTVWLSCSQRHAGNCRQLHIACQPIQSSRDSRCLAGTVARNAAYWTKGIERFGNCCEQSGVPWQQDNGGTSEPRGIILGPTSVEGDILSNSKGQASHDSSNMGAMTIAIIGVVVAIHGVAW